MIRFFILLFLIVSASFLQAYGFDFFLIRPNLALSAIAACAFFIPNRALRILAASLAAFVLKGAPSDVGLMLSLLSSFFVVSELVWTIKMREYILVPLATILGSAILYILLAPSMLFSFVFVKETVINALIAAGLYLSLAQIFSTKELKIRGE